MKKGKIIRIGTIEKTEDSWRLSGWSSVGGDGIKFWYDRDRQLYDFKIAGYSRQELELMSKHGHNYKNILKVHKYLGIKNES